jgi:putative FmdB family regulatory protein
MIYTYYCRSCGYEFTRELSVDKRERPTYEDCPRCSQREIRKMINSPHFRIKGARAANGYSDTVGDVEKFTGKKYEPEDD